MVLLSTQQQELLESSNIELPNKLGVALESESAELLSLAELVTALEGLNILYRAGQSIVSDHDYDHLFLAELQRRDPAHAFLNHVEEESEGSFEGEKVDLSQRMLSTDKAYDLASIERWGKRIISAAIEAGHNTSDLIIDITPKLDGFAALDNGDSLVTRGNGYRGTDISRVFERGLQVAGSGERGLGPGEIVVNSEYFDEYLVNHFDNTRNFQGSIIKEKALGEHAQKAIDNGAAVFFPFSELPRWQGDLSQLLSNFDEIVDEIWSSVPYDIDGVVIEAPALRDVMGHTSHHHRNTIAFKRNEAPVPVPVLGVTFQTGKSGRITPVAELEPTRISDAVLSRATLHNVGWAENKEVGVGAVALIVRSGLVIPKVVGVTQSGTLVLPHHCSDCGSAVMRDGDNLYCSNTLDCSAQVEATLEYFFKTLGSCNGFGPKTIEKLNQEGINTLEAIYNLTLEQLTDAGFGEATASNLLGELERSKGTPVEDWRFLAAFSLHNVGRGGCERVLRHFPLVGVFDVSKEDLLSVDGFADKKAVALMDALFRIRESFQALHSIGFNLIETPLMGEEVISENPIKGKTLVFTGSMQHAKRDDMKKEAKAMGAKVSGSVTGNTDYLIIGEKVGATKINAAKEKGTTVIAEADYLKLIGKDL